MFDIGFFELCVIGIVALLVLGPERLPHAVRMTGAWIGKIRGMALSAREEIEREFNTYEAEQRIKSHLNQQVEETGLKDAADSMKELQEQLQNGLLDEAARQEIEERGLTGYTDALTEQLEQALQEQQAAMLEQPPKNEPPKAP